MRRIAFALSSLALVLVPSCKDDESNPDNADTSGADDDDDAADDAPIPETSADDDGSGSTTGSAPVDGPTYYDDVLPIFVQQCGTCHAAGGIGPFDISTYETARLLAPSIAGQVEARIMPPFVADNSGACNTFKDPHWLTDEQIDTIVAWNDAGAPEGDPTAEIPEPPVPTVLAGDDIQVLSTPMAYAPVSDEDNGVDDYQCFLADPGIVDAPRYVIGHDVVPGNPEITHHLIGFLVDPAAPSAFGGTNGELMASLDDATPDQPGWNCFGTAGDGIVPAGSPVGWAPGEGATNFPEGTGIKIEPGQVLVLQMHYNLLAGDGEDQTDVHLSFVDEVDRELVSALDDRFLATLFNGTSVEIPPGMESFVWQWVSPIRDFDSRISGWPQVELLGVTPHMHGLGRRMQVEIIRSEDDSRTCAIWVDRWNFNWQRAFFFEEPIIMSPFDRFEVTCDWDSTSRENPTFPGLGTQQEMCLLGIYAAPVE
jgi:hypothetical protein